MRYFLAIAQTATALFFRRLCALLSFCILSILLSISSASAQFLSDGVTPVTPIPDNATFRAARTACLNESAVTGRCQNYGDTSGYGDMENWDTSLVTVMNAAFNSNVSFNGDISGWDTSKVTDMGTMFFGASTFNQDLSRWNITNVVDMAAMFSGARAFNQDISKWVTSKLTNMSFMFEGASAFNQDLSGWNTSKVTDMAGMFKNAVAFDQEIRGWDVSKVGRFTNMFDGATAFAATYGTVPGFGATPTAAFFTPPASSDATLSALSLSSGSLSPGFASGTLAYTASVANSVSSLIVTPTTNDANATATVNGASATTPVTLALGSNTVTVQVTVQDGVTTQSYTVAVTRAASSDATLSALALSQGSLSPSFTSGTLAYTASVAHSVSSLIVTPTTNDANATATVNGASPATPVTLSAGSNTVTVQVTAQDGTTQSYTVAVTRAASSDATLSALTLSQGSLSPSFASGTLAYTSSVPNSVSSLIVTPTTNDANATATVNGASAATPVTLAVGSNTVTVQVTAQDGTTIQSYTVAVTRAASSDATLSALTLSSGSLNPSFASGTLAYTALVSNSVSSLIVTPTTNDANATATVNGASPATPVTLAVGSNPVTVQVTAQDGSTQSYTVAVTRAAASSDATLSALALSSSSLSPSFASGTLAYTASVVHSVSSLIVTPSVNDANATATVNGASAATPVNLAVGSNTVTVQVTAQDGTTTQNYTVTVTRAAALTVALTGPLGTVTWPFTVTATLSSQVVSFVASDVTVVNGQVTGVTGSGTSYAIAVKPVLGQQVFVSVAAGVVSTALGTSNQLSNILQVQAGSPATALAAHEDELAAVIRGEAGRELRAGLAADQRMVRAGFQRFMARRQSNAQGVNGFVPFDITGTARYRNGSFRTNGDFFALSTVGGKQWHRVAFGDFDFLSYSLGNSSGYLTARLAYETQFSQDVMLGYYIGADIGKVKVGGTFNGTQNSVGLSFGGYFNRIYNDKLIVSGFASLGQRQHDFDASNTTLAVSSDYRTATGRVGGSVTGFIERWNITIAPELAFNVARTNVHSIPISGTAYGLTNNNLSLDVGGVDLASISFTPHVKLRVADHVMPGYRSSFSIGPKISCEAVRASSLSKDCGTGGVLGMTMISNDGATVFQAELEQEGIGGTKRRSVKLSFQHQF
ncbi:cadherin-like beta sandwich domain-containing protein [Planktomarina temperata]|nr:cadherin-like beta sandwich domain-containing protein [Planktomarina temperata]